MPAAAPAAPDAPAAPEARPRTSAALLPRTRLLLQVHVAGRCTPQPLDHLFHEPLPRGSRQAVQSGKGV